MIQFLICNKGFQETNAYTDDVWVHVIKPDRQEITILENDFGVPASFMNDIQDSDERPRIETEDNWRMIIIRVPIKLEKENGSFGTVPLGILTSGEKFITVCYHDLEMIDDFIFFSRRKSFEKIKANDLILHLMFSSSIWFIKYSKLLDAEINHIESQLQRSIRNEELLEMMRIEHTLVHFITSLQSNELLLRKFKTILTKTQTPFDDDLLEDVEVELLQAQTTANVYSDILAGMMDAFSSIISNNVNGIMKRLTAFSIVLMFPTLVASYFGMNLQREDHIWTAEFSLIIAASVLISLIGVWFFRKKNWM